MDDTNQAALLSALRSIIAVIGGALAAHGYINQSTVNELIGPIMVIIPLAWGVVDKYLSAQKTQARVEEAYNAGSTNMPMPDPKKPAQGDPKP